MAKLDRENDLHLTQLSIGSQIFVPPSASAAANPAALMTPRALTLHDAAPIFAEIARYGYTSLQQVGGGVRIASADGVSAMTLTGSGWQFVEDLNRSAFDAALEKMSVSIRAFLSRLPGALLLPQTVDLQATWENLGQAADEHIEHRFLTAQARQVVEGVPGCEFVGGGVRLHIQRPWASDTPQGFFVLQGGQADQIDVRLEPLFADRSKLFLQVTGVFGPPTSDLNQVTAGTQFVHQVLWNHVAANIQMEV
jgi:hypothetical protein